MSGRPGSVPALAAALWIGIVAAARPAAAGDARPLVLHPGLVSMAGHFGYGWSPGERGPSGRFRWIERLEADVWFEGAPDGDAELRVRAAPFPAPDRLQVVGIYLNNTFAGSWTCPRDAAFEDYVMRLPAGLFRPGRNRLTFRLAYRASPRSRDPRELALAVRRIEVAPADGS